MAMKGFVKIIKAGCYDLMEECLIDMGRGANWKTRGFGGVGGYQGSPDVWEGLR